ncbi:MAG: hypothetical protein ACOVVK_19335, partial [Elsteraceae bacterium]
CASPRAPRPVRLAPCASPLSAPTAEPKKTASADSESAGRRPNFDQTKAKLGVAAIRRRPLAMIFGASSIAARNLLNTRVWSHQAPPPPLITGKPAPTGHRDISRRGAPWRAPPTGK